MRLLSLFMILCFTSTSFAGGQLTGKVTDTATGKGLPAANITVENSYRGATTDKDGVYTITLDAGAYRVTARYMGYKPVTLDATIADGETTTIDFGMDATSIQSGEIVITATKTERQVSDVPGRVQIVTPGTIQSMPVFSVDDALANVSGLTVSRNASVLSSKSTVSMRGMGNEQGRTLILLDGIPINKTDGGTVNWNYINASSIEKIEIAKGPGSSLYGGNAMGGVINLMTKRPTKLFSATVANEYGTFNSIGTRAYLTSAYNNWTFKINGMARKSDGYIADTNVVDTSYNKVKADMSEQMIGGGVGYRFNDNHQVDLTSQYYSGMRGNGKQYDLGTDKGNRTVYDNTLHSIRYQGGMKDWKWLVSAFMLHETYDDRNESFSRGAYSRYDVDSKRDDKGFSALITKPLGGSHTLTGGFEFKHGAVDAVDEYITSSDEVINKGKMDFAATYLQDEWSLLNNRVRIAGSVRYDHAKFFDGIFRVDSSTSVTSFLRNYQDTTDSYSWNAISPKLAVQVSPLDYLRVYASYGHGFRPPVLDDMCRSGRFNKGFKVINPALKPEKNDNFEFGLDVKPMDNLLASATVYHSIGDDFIYYISTGDTAMISGRPRAIFQKDNISRVKMTGFEFDLNYQPHRMITLFTNFSTVSTEISKYKVNNPKADSNLTGFELTDVPEYLFTAGTNLKYKWFGLYGVYRYKGKQWYDEMNTQRVKSYATVDLKFTGTYQWITVGVSVQNLFDKTYLDSKGIPSAGRMVFAELTVNY